MRISSSQPVFSRRKRSCRDLRSHPSTISVSALTPMPRPATLPSNPFSQNECPCVLFLCLDVVSLAHREDKGRKSHPYNDSHLNISHAITSLGSGSLPDIGKISLHTESLFHQLGKTVFASSFANVSGEGGKQSDYRALQ